MKIVLFATYYENKLMVAARRWRSLAYFLCNEGVELCVVTPGKENKEFVGEYGEKICTFKSLNRKANVANFSNTKRNKRIFPSPFPYLDISFLSWMGAFNNKNVQIFCAQSEVFVSTYGPSGAMLFGLGMAYRHKKPWILDLRDSFQIDSSIKSKLLIKLNHWVEKKIIEKASLCITVGEVLASYLSTRYQTDFKYIYNGWLDSDEIGSDRLVVTKINLFLYAGSIYSHQLPALKVFLDSLKEYKQHHKLRIYLIRDYSGYLYQWLEEHEFELLVEIYAPVCSEKLAIEMASSKGVLVIEDLTPLDWQKGTVTGKLFSLLVSGVPGIVISHRETELFSLALKAEGWFCAYDAEGCQQAIYEILKIDKTTLVKNKKILSEYHFSYQAKKIKGLFETTIEKYHDSRK